MYVRIATFENKEMLLWFWGEHEYVFVACSYVPPIMFWAALLC